MATFIITLCACLLLSSDAMAVKVKHVMMGITDDEIASAIKDPKPLSVSRIITTMQQPGGPMEMEGGVEEWDLGENNITHKGATVILGFAKDLPTLRKLSFYNNRVYDVREQEGYADFEGSLLILLGKDTFKELDLRLNGIANLSWFQHIMTKAGDNARKIKW
ncbi:MAG: hypothetical protein K2P93_05385 [Alphaproteobacteria bacterium]|nr:hypothetical protein [Alphaproteobacteria bacterium]